MARPRPLEETFEVSDERAHQVGEEDGEQESDERVVSDVEEAESQCKEEHRDQDPSRT